MDWDAVRQIVATGLRAEIWGFSRAVAADVEALVELGLSASVIESPISDLKLGALGVSREMMIERITTAVAFAAASAPLGRETIFFARGFASLPVEWDPG